MYKYFSKFFKRDKIFRKIFKRDKIFDRIYKYFLLDNFKEKKRNKIFNRNELMFVNCNV